MKKEFLMKELPFKNREGKDKWTMTHGMRVVKVEKMFIDDIESLIPVLGEAGIEVKPFGISLSLGVQKEEPQCFHSTVWENKNGDDDRFYKK